MGSSKSFPSTKSSQRNFCLHCATRTFRFLVSNSCHPRSHHVFSRSIRNLAEGLLELARSFSVERSLTLLMTTLLARCVTLPKFSRTSSDLPPRRPESASVLNPCFSSSDVPINVLLESAYQIIKLISAETPLSSNTLDSYLLSLDVIRQRHGDLVDRAISRFLQSLPAHVRGATSERLRARQASYNPSPW